MNITCSKDLLINNISIVSRAVAQRTTQPILECILLIADRKGFRLMGNNLELSIETAVIEADVYEQGSVALNSRLFSNIIRSLPTEEVSIVVDSNNCAVIKSGRSEFKLMGFDGSEFPQPPEVEKNQTLEVNALTLKAMIKQTIFSVATDETRPVLMGEFMEITPYKLNLVAIDGFRVSYRTTPVYNYDNYNDIIVPAKALSEISAIAPSDENENISLFITDRHILFEMSSCTMVSRLIEGQYMEYENLFNTDSSLVVTADREELLHAIERAVLIVKDPKKAPVTLEIKDGLINITSKAEVGQVFEQVNIESDGDPITINFNANYLVDVLKNIEDETVVLNFMSPLSPCIIKNNDKDDYKYLVLPLRM